MTVSRRLVLAGMGAATLPCGAHAQGARYALDEAATLLPDRALARLAGVAAATVGERLDLAAARSGLAIDVALAAFPPASEQRAALTVLRDRGTPGAVRLAHGAAYLALILRRQLGDTPTLEAAEQRLHIEREWVERRAHRLFNRIGVAPGPLGQRFATLWRDGRHLYADDAFGRAEAVADMNATLTELRPRVAAACGFAVPPCSVRALTPQEIAAAKGGFRQLPTATAPGYYAVDLKDIRRRPAWTLPSVVAHELVPGHLLQLPVEAAAAPHPLRLSYATAFVEGWGAYAETLAAGWSRFDALAMLGHCHWLLFRLGRGLVDLGIHAHGWSLAQARARLVAWQGEPAYFAPFDTDLARIAIEPGVRAAEALAWLGIADRARLASDLPAFHRAVVTGGRVRLEQLP